MCAELVTLYTTANIDDPSPQAFQYYLDYSGAQCLQVAMQNLGMQFDYKYGLLLRSTEMKWLDLNDTLRNQGQLNNKKLSKQKQNQLLFKKSKWKQNQHT